MALELPGLVCSFHGSVETRSPESESEIVSYLNAESGTIAEEIQRELSHLLGDVNVRVLIEFQRGTIDWNGIVTLWDWVGRFALAWQLVKPTLEYVLRTVVERWLRARQVPLATAAVIEINLRTPISRLSYFLSTGPYLLYLTVLNTALLLALIISQFVTQFINQFIRH